MNNQSQSQPALSSAVTPEPLNPMSFPLVGERLIEASAGTGKTYTITALYLRLLLGQSEQKPLLPEEILVVTFTEAATEELRDRIRHRIVEARNAFVRGQSDDPILQHLLSRSKDHRQDALRLNEAAQNMDEATIFTIHGFCQRMLKRHAFESGALFESELTDQSDKFLSEAVYDFWRKWFYRQPREIAEAIYACWKEPDSLKQTLIPLLSPPSITFDSPVDETTSLKAGFEVYKALLEDVKRQWLALGADEIYTLIQSSGINKSSYSKRHLPGWLAKVTDFCESQSTQLPKDLARFDQETLMSKTKKGEYPKHPLFSAISALLAAQVPVKDIIIQAAYHEVKSRLASKKTTLNVLAFDDLLNNLHSALHGDAGLALAKAIRDQFPVAMIDEFQDTDLVQYEIFTAIWRHSTCSINTAADESYLDIENTVEQASVPPALVMIGDPKQAIYAFRGADIFTYIRARREISHHYTLDKNWRSTPKMIAGVNHLFAQHPAPFIYQNDIAFLSVKAGKTAAKHLTLNGRSEPALQLWFDGSEEPISKAQYLTTEARATAAKIEKLLTHGEIDGTPVVAGDIAILVRDRFEADEVRNALAQTGRPCVYLSNRDSVFNTQEALDLMRLLTAIDRPEDERHLRAGMATQLLGLNIEALELLNQNENTWEQAVEEFTAYQAIWARSGVLPMVRALMHRRGLNAHILAGEAGDRRLTDIYHIAELLQAAGRGIESRSGLIRWFMDEIANANGSRDEQQLRLESDSHLVTIVTIHKSKGLEYPIVFVPFPCLSKEAKSAIYHKDDSDVVFDPQASDDSKALADKERLAEDLRLLYVALTRSIYACYLGVASVKQGNSKKCQLRNSALGYLLLHDQEANLTEALASLNAAIKVNAHPEYKAQPDLLGLLAPDDTDHAEQQSARLSARKFTGKIKRNWRVTSYTALSHTQQSRDEMVLPRLDLEAALDQNIDLNSSTVAATEAQEQDAHTIFTFPKGAKAGTFLHTLFETIDFTHVPDDLLIPHIQSLLDEQGYEAHWLPVLVDLVRQVLHAPLPCYENSAEEIQPSLLNPPLASSQSSDEFMRLGDIDNQARLVEMEFMLSVDNLKGTALSQLCQRLDSLSAQAPSFTFDSTTGLLKGFIDLTFRHQGKYYILDYKSNYLGDQPSAYSKAAMGEAMLDHRYDLQYQIYALALHRLLAQRLPHYDYEQHFGGVIYLFLRGINADNTLENNPGVWTTRPSLSLVQSLDRMFGGE